MVTGYGGPDARVDADKEDAQAGPDAVLQPQLRPFWFNNSAFRFHFDLRNPALVFSSSARTSLGPFCVINAVCSRAKNACSLTINRKKCSRPNLTDQAHS